ncbi:hypothetical protein J5J86_12490 [Aquabacter sp. L1I39]|uniref:hypothetical protein n=1 Tax=Aquabacter sp. L1I39 TaxID=2820278 RepID=UPI001ADB92C5|nr:hypothetical protein [Aquabacter sp. L1I39]QTL01639.1 hypothetical protein J5J86_12490 [Aquabacter sp. L1I39]
MTMNKDQQRQPQQGMQRHEDMPRKPVEIERPDPSREPSAGQQSQGTPQRGPVGGQQQGGQPAHPRTGQQGQSAGTGGQQGGSGERQSQPGVKDDIRTDLSRDNPYRS